MGRKLNVLEQKIFHFYETKDFYFTNIGLSELEQSQNTENL